MPRGKASAAPGGGLNKVKNGGIARKKGNLTSAPKNLAPVLNDPTSGSNPPAKNDDDKMDIDVEEVDPGDTPDLPDVDGEPPAWAEGRTGLGDALPWFRKFQGGMYTRDGICYGVLLSADSGVRSYVDDEIIITRVGGGSERNAEGQLNQVADQKDDNCIVRSLRNSMNFKIAVGAIIGAKNTNLGRKLPHEFNVMGYFSVAYIWHEKINNRVAVRFRLEKLNLSEKSWWAKRGTPTPVPYDQRLKVNPPISACSHCNKTYPRIYNEGWMCLTPQCSEFWKLNGHDPPEELTYHSKFLQARVQPDPDIQPHYSLVPDYLKIINDNDPHVSSSRLAWKAGIVCPQCRQCISRRYWRGWKCNDDTTNGGCNFERMLKMHPLSIRAVIDDFELAPIKRAIVFDPSDKEKGQLITPQIDDRSFSPYRKFTYTLPGAGTVTQFVSNRQINSRPDGPDDIFQQLQEVDLGLRRYPLSAAKVGGTLNAQFAVNYGMPYDFVVDVDSRAFSEACDPILRVLGRLTWATDKAVEAEGEGGTAQKPNELLALGYFEDMNINYHDDGESTLGPTIASLSLGSNAVKTLRMKYKYYYGLTKNTKNVLDPKADPVLEGCAGREWRLKLKQELANGSIAEKDYKEEWKKRQKEWAGGRRLGDPPVRIITELHHGDMVVMNGEGVQKYYEHAVALEKGGGSKLRFALTARHVIKEKLGNKSMGQAWKGDFKLTPGQTYDGK